MCCRVRTAAPRWQAEYTQLAACHALVVSCTAAAASTYFQRAPQHSLRCHLLAPAAPQRAGRNGLKWTADLAAIDLHYYLPIFVDGLLEMQACAGQGGAGGDSAMPCRAACCLAWLPLLC